MKSILNLKTIVFATMLMSVIASYGVDYTIWHITDTHVMAPEVCKTQGSAWKLYNFQEPQLDLYSPKLFQAIIDSALTHKPDIIVISGDMTKNGEKASHELVVRMMKPLVENGIKVYVVPGNHDLHNPTAYLYDGDNVTRSPQLTEDEFAELYKDYGYGTAESRDDSTLSYVAYPTPDLALLCMDANDWSTAITKGLDAAPDTTERVSCAGKYLESTLQWMESEAVKARNSGRRVFVVQHQTMFQHFDKESSIMGSNMVNPDDSVNNEQVLVQRMAGMGVEVIFSGHRHMHDINYQVTEDDKKLWEINTGATIEHQPVYRTCELTDEKIDVNTVVLRNVDLDGKGTSTDEYAHQWFFSIRQDFLRAFCLATWPTVQEKLSALPAIILSYVKLPTTFGEYRGLLDRHLVDLIMKAYYIISVGNEPNVENVDQFIEDIQAGIDAAVLEMCNGDEDIKLSILSLLRYAYPDLDLSEFAKNFFSSPLGNYISQNGGVVVDDFTCSIPLRQSGSGGIYDGISVAHSAMANDSDIYDISGRKMNANQIKPGVYIKAGRKYVQK